MTRMEKVGLTAGANETKWDWMYGGLIRRLWYCLWSVSMTVGAVVRLLQRWLKL